MPPPYQQPHWDTVAGIPFMAQGPVGLPPSVWAARFGIVPPVGAGWPQLPNHPLDRHTVRLVCQNAAVPVLFGYICAMAWGRQDRGQGGPAHVTAAWANRATISGHLTALRVGGLTRRAAYRLFLSVPIPGLGPSFFTKLLYFFSPQPNCYIMDQWTAKSVILLTNSRVVRMAGHVPARQNKGGNYQAFCEELDLLGGQLGCSGQVAEERLFSQGGRHPWPWRAHVDANWPPNPPLTGLRAADLHAIYPHIPQQDF